MLPEGRYKKGSRHLSQGVKATPGFTPFFITGLTRF